MAEVAVSAPDVSTLPERARSIATKTCRPVYWHEDRLWLIDQRKLPEVFEVRPITTLEGAAGAIRTMVVRGAPAIGATGAYGVVIAARAALEGGSEDLIAAVSAAKVTLDAARPTAVNLMWATDRMERAGMAYATAGLSKAKLVDALLEEAHAICDEDVAVNKRMAEYGADLVPDGANILHHCNTGALATVDIGTALGVVYECHLREKGIHVWVDETRPRLQGSRLTAWELLKAGVDMHLIADSAAGLLMLQGKVDVVLYGADRVAANGDVVNKVGTYKVSVCARENGVAVYAVVPTSTIDLSIEKGLDIPIEERSASEVTHVRGETSIAPADCPVFNPAFDVTPHRYLTGIITEHGVCYPPFSVSLPRAVEKAKLAREEAMRTRVERASALGGGGE